MMTPLAEAGAVTCDSNAEVVHHADIVITHVSNISDVEAVILGPGGVIEGALAGMFVIDMTTISLSSTRHDKEHFECGCFDQRRWRYS